MSKLRYWKSFPLVLGQRVVSRLEKAGIKFELDFDDSSIKQMTPAKARWGQSGLEVKMMIYLSKVDVRKAEKLAEK